MAGQAQKDKVEPCDICGDVGFGEAIVTCSKCKVTREHVYCMRINLTEVPNYWLCETCESNKWVSFIKCKLPEGNTHS